MCITSDLGFKQRDCCGAGYQVHLYRLLSHIPGLASCWRWCDITTPPLPCHLHIKVWDGGVTLRHICHSLVHVGKSNTKLSAPLYLTLIWPNCSFSHFSLHFILQILAWYTFLPPSTFLPLNIINSNKNSWSHPTGSLVLCSTPPSAVLSPPCSWHRKFETQRFSPPWNMLFYRTFSIIWHKWLTRALIRFLKS